MMEISWRHIQHQLIDQKVSIAPLTMFRVLFGFMMSLSIVRFLVNGWVYDQYIAPQYHFSYFGFEWVKNPGEIGIYVLFGLCLISAISIMIGFRYRIAAVLFFLSFTYIELIDKTNYLNHYYFISLMAFLMIFLPANQYFSVDAWLKGSHQKTVAAWTVNTIKFQLAIVYVFAGIAKLNSDWLIEAMPLKLWLPANSHLPIIGSLMEESWVAYAFSWGGAFYDLFIVGFLLYKPTRLIAYSAVIFFHIITWILFPIGMFPWIMILSTLIYFSAEFHEKVISVLSRFFKSGNYKIAESKFTFKPLSALLIAFFVLQLLLPWRYLLYPGDLFWNEQGYRFSWRVMLMEKAGYTTLHVKDPETGKSGQIANYEFLTPQQEKMMSTQPDMILQFAHIVEDYYQNQGIEDPIVYAESYVTLNGRKSQLFLDPKVDLTKEKDSFKPKSWILPNCR